MPWLPISLTVPQYEDANGEPYSGAVLKAYAAGTSTNTPFATDSTGATQANSIALNASGFPAVSGNVVIPHIDQSYKLALYPTQAAADANSGAIWSIDNLTPVSNIGFANAVNSQTVTYTLLGSDEGKLILFSGAGGVELDLLAADDAGEGYVVLVENATSSTVTIDPDGSEQVNGAATLVIPSGGSGALICTGTAWRFIEFLSFGESNLTGAMNFAEGTAVAAAATTNVWATNGNTIHVTGNGATITSLGTAPQAGAWRLVIWDDVNTLTHGANLNLQNSANIATAAGDISLVYADTTTQLDVIHFPKATRQHVEVFTSSGTFTAKVTGTHTIILQAGGGGGGVTSGGNGANSCGGGGGGAAGEYRVITQSLTAGTGYTVTIGAGGASTTAGGNTTFDATTVTGGADGSDGGIPTAGSGGRSGTVSGGTAGTGATAGSTSSGQGDGAAGGNGAAASAGGGGGGGGGCSHFGKGGVGGNGGANQATSGSAGTAAAATAYGAGGGGAGGGGSDGGTSGATGGAGANGIIIVNW